MRKSKKFWPGRSRTFRSLVVVAGALMLMTAFAQERMRRYWFILILKTRCQAAPGFYVRCCRRPGF